MLVVVALLGDYLFRCRGKPLSRDEALQRATAKVQRFSQKFMVGETLPPLVEDRYDAEEKLWMFTFRNTTCEVIVVADRCHGTDIGGTNGCTPK